LEHIKSEDFGRVDLDIEFVVKMLKKAENRDHFSEVSVYFDDGKIYAVDELRSKSPLPRRRIE